jgi:hypothetical protein
MIALPASDSARGRVIFKRSSFLPSFLLLLLLLLLSTDPSVQRERSRLCRARPSTCALDWHVHLAVAACLRYDLRLWIQLNSDPGGQQQSARAATIDSKPIQQYVDGGGIQNHKVSRQGDTTFMLATAYSTQSSERSCSAPPHRRCRAWSHFRLPSASPRLDRSASACAAIFDSQPNKRRLLSERSFPWKSHFHSIHYPPFICHPLLSFAICRSMQVTACLHDRQAISHLSTMQSLANF